MYNESKGNGLALTQPYCREHNYLGDPKKSSKGDPGGTLFDIKRGPMGRTSTDATFFYYYLNTTTTTTFCRKVYYFLLEWIVFLHILFG